MIGTLAARVYRITGCPTYPGRRTPGGRKRAAMDNAGVVDQLEKQLRPLLPAPLSASALQSVAVTLVVVVERGSGESYPFPQPPSASVDADSP